MSDFESGAIPASSGGASSGTGGRAASAAPSVNQSQDNAAYNDIDQIAQTNRGMAAQDDADQGAEGEGWPEDGGDTEAEPTEVDELTQWRTRAEQAEQGKKGLQGSLQQAVERAQRAEATAQQLRYHQATQQITPQEAQFQADFHRYEALRDYLTPEQDQAAYGQLQNRAQVLHQARQLRERELHLAAREAQQAPQKRSSDLRGLQTSYQHHYGIEIPDHVLQRSKNWEHAVDVAYTYALGIQQARDGARAQVNGSRSGGAATATRSNEAPPVRGNRAPSPFGNKVGGEILKDYFDKQRRSLK